MSKVALRPRGANPNDHVRESALFGAQPERSAAEARAAAATNCHLPGQPGAPGDGDPPDRSGKLSPAIVKVALEGSASFLSDVDLVAVLLGAMITGEPVVMMARELLERWGGLEGLARLGPAMLASQPEVGSIKAMRFVAAVEFGWRVVERAARPRERVATPAVVAAWFGARIGGLDHEEMWVLSLDGRNGLLGAKRVAQGARHGCSVTARDILRLGLLDGAYTILLVHNHPGGDPAPSEQDIAMTKAVAAAADVVGIPLKDHVIVTSEGAYTSLLDLGVLDTY
jgi:DNA repair protein RadC